MDICENNIIDLTDKTNKVPKTNQTYIIDHKNVDNIKNRCSCEESYELEDGKYKHVHFKKSFDFSNYIITQYVNNSSILSSYNNYVKQCYHILDNYKQKHNRFSNLFYTTSEYLECNELIHSIEEEIKDLIIDLCYIKINDTIKKKYKSNKFLLFNFKLDTKFVDDLCKYIYFNNYQDYNELNKKYGGIYMLYFIKEENLYKTTKKLCYVDVVGDIYYKVS